MTVYLGKKPVGVTKIVKKAIPESRFGVKISDLLGTVDADGNYIPPTDGFVLDLTGVKSVPANGFQFWNMGYETTYGSDQRLRGIIANDVVSVGEFSFRYIAGFDSGLEYVYFDSLEEITKPAVFTEAFTFAKKASFKSLKRIKLDGTQDCFNNAFSKAVLEFDSVFPSLEFVSGGAVLAKLFKSSSSQRIKIYASKISSLINTSTYSSLMYRTFYNVYGDIYLPNCTVMQGAYVCGANYKNELHFAAANQAAIEACDGYSSMFGATAIYFDLMLTITVNGVVYDREYTIGGYTSWKDTNGNLVYTDATAEPAVGTVVYSDQGTTQVGTVEGVA